MAVTAGTIATVFLLDATAGYNLQPCCNKRRPGEGAHRFEVVSRAAIFINRMHDHIPRRLTMAKAMAMGSSNFYVAGHAVGAVYKRTCLPTPPNDAADTLIDFVCRRQLGVWTSSGSASAARGHHLKRCT
eukprot:m.371752 g.371752  ORF g.371752 m.371752 type:complete len:130 (+) comp28134_c1_seq5:501-890(+)